MEQAGKLDHVKLQKGQETPFLNDLKSSLQLHPSNLQIICTKNSLNNSNYSLSNAFQIEMCFFCSLRCSTPMVTVNSDIVRKRGVYILQNTSFSTQQKTNSIRVC